MEASSHNLKKNILQEISSFLLLLLKIFGLIAVYVLLALKYDKLIKNPLNALL